MSSSLPLEILDLIAGHLHDELTALKACCLVSKSWVPRTRRHLFDNVEFGSSDGSTLESWMQTFPDPSNSPARYTRSFSLFHSKVATATTSDALPWIRSFDRIVKLETDDNRHASFAQLRGLSPTLKHLNIYCSYAPTSEVLDFICSFPHLEDLSLSSVVCSTPGNADSSDAPPTLPKFNGSLLLNGSNRSITRKLLDLPGGLRFSKIVVSCPVEDCDLAEELVSTCSDTLEYLYIEFYRYAGDPWTPPSLNFSKVTKLMGVEFQPREPRIGWIIAALRTIESNTTLWLITINFTPVYTHPIPVDEATRQEWQELDHLLVHLWTARSIRPVFTYEKTAGLTASGVLVPELLPELTRMGAVNEV